MSLPHARLHESAHDRLGLRRGDDDWEDERWSDPATRVLVVAGTRIASPLTWLSPAETDGIVGTRLLLGDAGGVTHVALVAGREHAREGWVPVRGLLPELAAAPASDPTAPLVLHAVGMAEWLAATRFCSRCGGPLTPRRSGHELVCSDGHVHFPRTDPAVIMLITHGTPGADDELALLGRKGEWPPGRFSTLAGFCEPGETLEDTVRREVAEEAGVRVGEVRYVGNQPWPLPSSLMLGFTGVALGLDLRIEDDELAEARWVTRAELLAGAADGSLLLPGEVSISRSLIEGWVGSPLPGSW
ncbi:MAG: NAD(+) diphosphatase [Nocardioides sp.]|uniref:NAD(+) diphosphatase n=1 Tax=Nocardioides sp. TaxID=35761 RepID=UPI0039E42933